MKLSFGLGTATYHSIVSMDDFVSELLACPNSDMIEFIDTAPIYAHGHAESWVGRKSALSLSRKVITKVGLDYNFKTRVGFKIPRGKTLYNRLFPRNIYRIPASHVRQSYKKSLKNLEGIKPYGLLVHSYDGSQDSMNQLNQLQKLKMENRVMKIGISIDESLEVIPPHLDIIEIPANFGPIAALQDFHGLLIVNQVFQKKMTKNYLTALLQLNVEQVVLLCGSTRIERIISFINYWREFKCETEN